MEHIESSCSLESWLFFIYIFSIRILPQNRAKPEIVATPRRNQEKDKTANEKEEIKSGKIKVKEKANEGWIRGSGGEENEGCRMNLTVHTQRGE